MINEKRKYYCIICKKEVFMNAGNFGKHKKLHNPEYRKIMQKTWDKVGRINSIKLTGRLSPRRNVTMLEQYGLEKTNTIKASIKNTLQKGIKDGRVKKSFLTIGNGRGMSTLEKYVYFKYLDGDWKFNYAIGIKPSVVGYPRNYKIDFYNEKLKIGIEIDGKIHQYIERKLADTKKIDFLNNRGYKIIRITEHDIHINNWNKEDFKKWLSSF